MTERDIDPGLDPELDHVTRRRFVERMNMSTLVAAFLGPEAMKQDSLPHALDDTNLVHDEVRFESRGQQVSGFLCRPKTGGQRGGVIVIHEIFGLTDHIRDVACRAAQAGYDGLAVNFFSREGQPPSISGGFEPLRAWVARIPDAQLMDDIRAAADYLRGKAESNGKVGVVGFCWGGRVSMLAASEVSGLDAAVAYYGRIRQAEKTQNQPAGPIDLVERVQAPLQGHFGATDQSIPVADVAAYRDALGSHGKTAEQYVYPGAGHAFNNDTRESYHADAAREAWQRTLGWFGKYLKG